MNTAITTNGRETDRARMSAILQRIENDPTEGVVFLDEIVADGSLIEVGSNSDTALDLPEGWSEADAREMAAEAAAEHNALRGYSRGERALVKAGRLWGEDVVPVRSRLN